jgi:hypothetical protein
MMIFVPTSAVSQPAVIYNDTLAMTNSSVPVFFLVAQERIDAEKIEDSRRVSNPRAPTLIETIPKVPDENREYPAGMSERDLQDEESSSPIPESK